MSRRNGSKMIQPVSFSILVMHAWVRCGQTVRAEKILDKMEQGVYVGKGEDGRVEGGAPDVVSYTTLMNG